MKKIIGLLIIAVVILAAFLIHQVVAPRILRQQMISFMRENCQDCSFSLGLVSLGLDPRTVILHDVHLTQGNPAATEVAAKIPRLEIHLQLKPLLSQQVIFERIVASRPTVVVTEGDKKAPKSAPSSESSPWRFEVQHTQVDQGTFNYVRTYPKKSAVIHIRDIQATVNHLGNTPDWEDAMAEGEARGVLANSGGFVLKVSTPLFRDGLKVKVDLRFEDQELAGLNDYFVVSDGIQLNGKIRRGRGIVQINAKNLDGWVHARYQDLSVKFMKTKDRGALKTFFSNLISSIKMDADDIDEPREDQSKSVKLSRDSKETLIQFILRGLRDSALQIATS